MSNPDKTKISFPVSLPEVKEQVKELTSDNDNYLRNLIEVATEEAESITGLDFAYTKCVLTLYDFSGDTITINDGLYSSVDSIRDADDNDVASDNVLIDGYKKFSIELVNSISTDELVITYYTGWPEGTGKVANLASVKRYVLVRVDDMFGPERSSYSYTPLRSTNKADNLLNSLKGLV